MVLAIVSTWKQDVSMKSGWDLRGVLTLLENNSPTFEAQYLPAQHQQRVCIHAPSARNLDSSNLPSETQWRAISKARADQGISERTWSTSKEDWSFSGEQFVHRLLDGMEL